MHYHMYVNMCIYVYVLCVMYLHIRGKFFLPVYSLPLFPPRSCHLRAEIMKFSGI